MYTYHGFDYIKLQLYTGNSKDKIVDVKFSYDSSL